jgi:hypothetical protein
MNGQKKSEPHQDGIVHNPHSSSFAISYGATAADTILRITKQRRRAILLISLH